MKPNPLVELQKLGQSIWYDNIRRALITTGDLKRMIDEDDLRGVTSNPAIFEKAIAGSTDYKEALQELAAQGKTTDQIYEELAIYDIKAAADILLPVYEKTNKVDGYISLEVSPLLARDTNATIQEARRLWERLGRKNAMIKVPATKEGLPAIEQLIYEAINVNVTLIFSQDAHREVMEAYIRGLERRAAEGKPVDSIGSVASFFVSRIDTSVDSQLGLKMRRAETEAESQKYQSLLGKVAIANAKIAYQLFKQIFEGERFAALRKKSAMVQRPLWASTGTKDPNYSDVLYVDSLIGPDTVNTVPPATYTAFRDHGTAARTLDQDVEDAKETLARLEETGISLTQITDQLLEDAIKAFVDPFDKLMKAIEEQRVVAAASIVDRQIFFLGNYGPTLEKAVQQIDERKYVRRMWEKDPTIWKEDPSHAPIIQNALGWLTIDDTMLGQVDDLKAFADRVHADGFESVMLLGMGGSSLCPEVLRRTFGHISGSPKFMVLDSTDPATVKTLESSIHPEKTLFLVSSKSGVTTEPQMFYQYFFERVSQVKKERPGANFVAITDPGSPLEEIARRQHFRRVFLNPATDIGGRYSALSYYGMVPAALMGLDIKELLERATEAAEACERFVPTIENPGVRLGALLGSLATHQIDKVTLITPPPIDSLGMWIEQLIAASTGKEGQGIVPVAGETLGDESVYDFDRVFVYITTRESRSDEIERKLKVLQEAGHPVVRHVMNDALSMGREFFLWEVATAIAGALIGINPFDQPNVQESKDNTKKLLDAYRKESRLPQQEPLWEGNGCRLYGDAQIRKESGRSLRDYLAAHFQRTKAGDYIALNAFVMENTENEALLHGVRTHLRNSLKKATTFGFGPRFLHSTSQLHKGGPNKGVFLQITCDDAQDLPIPGEPYTFGVLKQAQALGDFQSLVDRQRRVIRFHTSKDVAAGLKLLWDEMQHAIPAPQR